MIRLLALVALLSSVSAHAWMTSTFTLNGTYLDLVKVTKEPAIAVSGKAVFQENLSVGHLVVNGKPFDCRSFAIGYGSNGGKASYVCSMDSKLFLAMLNESRIKDANFNAAMVTLASVFQVYPDEIGRVAFAIKDANGVENSPFTDTFLEPRKQLTEVDFSFASTDGTPF